MTEANKIVYGIIGSGWRAEFFIRIARELPDKFQVCGLVTRRKENGEKIEKKYGIKTYRSIEELLKYTSPSFVVVSVPGSVTASVIEELAERGIPVLSETPPAPDLDTLIRLNKLTEKGAKIQVAEQYHLQPLHAARIALARSGKLGEVNQVQVSLSHGYHGMSIIRRLLDIKFENAEINAFKFKAPFVAGPGRYGLSDEERMVEAQQEIAMINFGDKFAVYDFAPDQHRSFIRAPRTLVRGSRGEVSNCEVRYLKDFRTPIEYELVEKVGGTYENVEDFSIRGVLGGEEWLYVNPYYPAKLSEDEIAVASCVEKMDKYVKSGKDFYSLAEASQDHYLGMMVSKALKTGEKIITETQPWAY